MQTSIFPSIRSICAYRENSATSFGEIVTSDSVGDTNLTRVLSSVADSPILLTIILPECSRCFKSSSTSSREWLVDCWRWRFA